MPSLTHDPDLSWSILCLTLVVGGLFISRGELTIRELVIFITYLDMLVWPLEYMGFLFSRVVPTAGLIPSWPRSQILWKTAASPAKHSEWGPGLCLSAGFLLTFKTLSQLYFSLKKGQTLGIVECRFWENDPAQAPFAGAGCGCGFDLP